VKYAGLTLGVQHSKASKLPFREVGRAIISVQASEVPTVHREMLLRALIPVTISSPHTQISKYGTNSFALKIKKCTPYLGSLEGRLFVQEYAGSWWWI